MRVLVVEDEQRIAELVAGGLRATGFAVDGCATVADARAAIELVPYDLVVLDLGLPDGDGLAVLKTATACRDGLPVLMLTARDTMEDPRGECCLI